tara:strand:- start:566 stop:1150 length:585 start_codon:yes stop_codon:yes gene_type:complete
MNIEEDFDIFLNSDEYEDYDMLYILSRSNKIKYMFSNKSHYIVDYFLNNTENGKKYNDYNLLIQIYEEKYKHKLEYIKNKNILYINVYENNFSSTEEEFKSDEDHLINEYPKIEKSNMLYESYEDMEVTFEEFTNNRENVHKYIVNKNKLPTPPIFIKKKNYFNDNNQDKSDIESEGYDTCNEILSEISSEEEI